MWKVSHSREMTAELCPGEVTSHRREWQMSCAAGKMKSQRRHSRHCCHELPPQKPCNAVKRKPAHQRKTPTNVN